MGAVANEFVQLSENQRLVRNSIQDICDNFGHEYWREQSAAAEYPSEFVDTLSEQGWMGILIPEGYGGAGMTTTETVVMMEEIAASGGGFSAAQAVHGGIYNSVPLVKYGNEEQKTVFSRISQPETRQSKRSASLNPTLGRTRHLLRRGPNSTAASGSSLARRFGPHSWM